MMKRVIGTLLLLTVYAGSSMALMGVGALGAAYNYSGTTSIGYGLSVEMPMLPLPFVASRMEAVYIPVTNGSLMPVNITGSYKIPMTPVYLGAGAGMVIYNQTTTGFSAPGALNYNAFVGYEQNMVPLLAYFIQAGYEVIRINYTVAGVSLSADFTGLSVKGGFRFGF